MNYISQIDPNHFALIILISATSFAVFWLLDSMIHGKIVQTDITSNELTTHRIILTTSLVMMVALVLMYWIPLLILPVFIAGFMTRTAHEFIDEIHFHVDRCSPYESFLHLGMWISVLTSTAAMFIWGFFTQYNGIDQLPLMLYIWSGILFIVLIYVSIVEWKR